MNLHSFISDWKSLSDVVWGYGITVGEVLLILVSGYCLSRWFSIRFEKFLARIPHVDKTLVVFLKTAVFYSLIVLTLVIGLSAGGIETASIITVIGAAGLAVGLALQSTLSNIASGIMILILRPFEIGEFIEAGDAKGSVESIGLFSTQLRDGDGIFVMVPNSGLWSKTIKNFTRNQTRRVVIPVGISYQDSVTEARNLILKEIDEDAIILQEPAPQVLVELLDSSSVNLQVKFWVNRKDFLIAKSKMIQNIKEILSQHHISIPFPQSEITLVQKDKNL